MFDLSSIQHPASSIQHPVSSIQHPASSIQHPKKELIDFIIDTAKVQAYDLLTSVVIIDFVLNIMILPEKLETHFINYCHQKYLKMENSDTISGNTVVLGMRQK